MKKSVCVLLAFCLTLCGFSSAFAYVDGDFDETKYHLTGNMRDDIAGIALTQLGYHEGNTRREKDGLNESGGKNFIKYSEYCGYDAAWCAMFIVWCARKAGIGEDSGILDNTTCAAIGSGGEAFDVELYHWDEYTPRVGDLVFFDSKIKRDRWTGRYSNSGHVGLIVKIDDKKIYTVEGNCEDMVVFKKYTRDNSVILGYGVPNYENDETLFSKVNFPGKYEIIQSGKPSKLYQNKKKTVAKLAELNQKSLIFVSECDGKWGKVRYDGKDGYIDLTEASLLVPDFGAVVYNLSDKLPFLARIAKVLLP